MIYTVQLIGIKVDGSDDFVNIHASCKEEVGIIVETFHHGGYVILDDAPEDSLLKFCPEYYDHIIEQIEREESLEDKYSDMIERIELEESICAESLEDKYSDIINL